jgi:hypothetical protein
VTDSLARAEAFLEAKGNALERARMRGLLHGEPPGPDALAAIAVEGFASLRAACVVLAQLDDLPSEAGRELRDRALAFLAGRQREDASWQEDDADDAARRLDLTARCAFWVGGYAAVRAAGLLADAIGDDGSLPASLPAHWHAVVVLRRAWREREAARIARHLGTRLDELDAGSLARLAHALGAADALADDARARLAGLQREDGSWAGDVEATLAAVRALLR